LLKLRIIPQNFSAKVGNILDTKNRNRSKTSKNDAARRIATVFEKWNCVIEIYLRARRENPPKKIEPIRAFCRGLFLEYGGLNPILPFLEGRSGAACRVVIPPHSPFPLMPMRAQMMVDAAYVASASPQCRL